MIAEILSFRKLIAPFVIQVLFWGAALASVISGIWLIWDGVWGGWFALFLGPLGARVLFEIVIVVFRIYQSIEEIRKQITASNVTDRTLPQ